MRTIVYEKTDAGKHEVTVRGRLSQRLRTLLVMIDGLQPAGIFLDSLKNLGVTEESFKELIELGLIHQTGTAPAAPPPAGTGAKAPPPAPALAPAPGVTKDMHERLHELHAFFNGTVRETFGLRGFAMQLKVERAVTLDDFRQLRQPFIDAVRKSKGDTVAQAFAARLDALLKG